MLCLLGPAAVAVGALRQPLRLRPKAAAVLARVALAQCPVPRGELAGSLFGEVEAPRASVRWYLSNLRAALPQQLRGHLVLTAEGVEFTGVTDVGIFRAYATEVLTASTPPTPDGLEALAGVLELYRGDLCEGLVVSASVAFDTWLFVEQEQLRRLFRQTVLLFARAAIRADRAEIALAALTRLVAVDPYCEDAHLQLISAGERAGDLELARAGYEQYQRIGCACAGLS